MNFDEWWATLSPPERRVIGEHNARFVWKEAVEMCAKVCDSSIHDTYIEGYTGAKHSARRECAAAIRAKGQ